MADNGTEHCWHASHTVQGNPVVHVDLCCHCGNRRETIERDRPRLGHGPFAPPVKFPEVTYLYDRFHCPARKPAEGAADGPAPV